MRDIEGHAAWRSKAMIIVPHSVISFSLVESCSLGCYQRTGRGTGWVTDKQARPATVVFNAAVGQQTTNPVWNAGTRQTPWQTPHPLTHHWQTFLARDSIYAEHAICYRPSLRPSVARVDQSKTVEVRIMKFSLYSSPIPLVFTVYVLSRNSDWFPLCRVIKQVWGEESIF